MDARAIIVILLYLSIGPLLIYSDGGLIDDNRLRHESLEPISDVTSLGVCRTRLGIYHYCRHHVIKDDYDKIFRYRFISQSSSPNVEYLRSVDSNDVTTSTGMAYFKHRVIFIVLASLFGLGMALFELSKHISFTRTRPATPQHNSWPVSERMRNSRSPQQTSFGKRKGF